VELYEKVTGQSFEPETHPAPQERIRAALDEYVLAERS
jgi:phosphoribosylaminoimidazole-succinocarboxamide synthase